MVPYPSLVKNPEFRQFTLEFSSGSVPSTRFLPYMGAANGSMVRAGPRFVVPSSGAKHLSCTICIYVYIKREREREREREKGLLIKGFSCHTRAQQNS